MKLLLLNATACRVMGATVLCYHCQPKNANAKKNTGGSDLDHWPWEAATAHGEPLPSPRPQQPKGRTHRNIHAHTHTPNAYERAYAGISCAKVYIYIYIYICACIHTYDTYSKRVNLSTYMNDDDDARSPLPHDMRNAVFIQTLSV